MQHLGIPLAQFFDGFELVWFLRRTNDSDKAKAATTGQIQPLGNLHFTGAVIKQIQLGRCDWPWEYSSHAPPSLHPQWPSQWQALPHTGTETYWQTKVLTFLVPSWKAPACLQWAVCLQ